MENTEEKKGTYTEFRNLIKTGMGSRTVTAFADEAGIGRTTMSRILNQDEIVRPKEDTVEKIAKALNGISVGKLRQSVGYQPMDMRKVAMSVHERITTMKKEYFIKEDGHIFDKLEGFGEIYNLLYAGTEDMAWEVFKHGEDKPVKTAIFLGTWTYGDYRLETMVCAHYVVIEGGSVYITDIATEKDEIKSYNLSDTYWKPFIEPSEKESKYIFEDSMTRCMKETTAKNRDMLLESIFGFATGNIYPLVYHGFGFYYKETPEGFADFLTKYRSIFCTDDEKTMMYKQVMSGGNPDEVFEKYPKDYAYGDYGTGAVVAEIMSKLFNMPFTYDKKDEHNEEDDSCIITTTNTDADFYPPENVSMRFMKDLSSIAESLRIKEYGNVYHTMYLNRVERMTFDTEEPIKNVYEEDGFIPKAKAEEYLEKISSAAKYHIGDEDIPSKEKAERVMLLRAARNAKEDLKYLNRRYKAPMDVPVSKRDVKTWDYLLQKIGNFRNEAETVSKK